MSTSEYRKRNGGMSRYEYFHGKRAKSELKLGEVAGKVKDFLDNPAPVINMGHMYAYPTAEQEAAMNERTNTPYETLKRIEERQRQLRALQDELRKSKGGVRKKIEQRITEVEKKIAYLNDYNYRQRDMLEQVKNEWLPEQEEGLKNVMKDGEFIDEVRRRVQRTIVTNRLKQEDETGKSYDELRDNFEKYGNVQPSEEIIERSLMYEYQKEGGVREEFDGMNDSQLKKYQTKLQSEPSKIELLLDVEKEQRRRLAIRADLDYLDN